MDLRRVVISSARLRLVQLSFRYKNDIFREFTPEVTQYMMPASPKTMADTENFIRAKQEEMRRGRDLTLVIIDREDGEFLGCCGVHNLQHRTPELGIWIKKGAQGKGYGREAIAALVNWAGPHLGTLVLRYPVDERNTPSRNLIESLGGSLRPGHQGRTVKNQAGEDLQEVTYFIRCPFN